MFTVRPSFQGTQFSRIAISKHFAETTFADQEFRVYRILKFHVPDFRGLLGTAETAKTTRLENLHVYSSGKFSRRAKFCVSYG